jgi:hypothetical protein
MAYRASDTQNTDDLIKSHIFVAFAFAFASPWIIFFSLLDRASS